MDFEIRRKGEGGDQQSDRLLFIVKMRSRVSIAVSTFTSSSLLHMMDRRHILSFAHNERRYATFEQEDA
jgi:hypothetical protein